MIEPIYNEIGEHYSKYRRADPRLVEAIVDLLDIPKGSIVAEVGAGTGNYSRAGAFPKYDIVLASEAAS